MASVRNAVLHSNSTAINSSTLAAAAPDEFDDLVIAAPDHTLAAIRAGLDSTAAERLVGTLMKNLVNAPADELWPHLRQCIRPIYRA